MQKIKNILPEILEVSLDILKILGVYILWFGSAAVITGFLMVKVVVPLLIYLGLI